MNVKLFKRNLSSGNRRNHKDFQQLTHILINRSIQLQPALTFSSLVAAFLLLNMRLAYLHHSKCKHEKP